MSWCTSQYRNSHVKKMGQWNEQQHEKFGSNTEVLLVTG